MTMFVSYPFRVPATNAPLYWQSAYEPTHRFTYLQFHPEPNEDGIEIDASYAMEEDFSVSVFNERYKGTSLCFPIIPNASLPSIKALAHDAKLEAMLQRISDAYLSEFHEGQWRGSFPGLPEGFEKEVIDHLAEVLSEDALKMVPASQYVRGGNLELFILCELLSFEGYAEKLVHLAEHEGVLLVGDVVDEVAKWCAEEVEYDIETYLEPDETLHLLIFLLKRHDKAKYGYLLDLFKAHYPEVEVPLFAKTYS